jgi:D-alanine-D-alanine ligase
MISYDTKWKYDSLEWKRVHHICPAVVTDEIAARIRNVARQTIAAFGIQRCSRLDMRMDDQGGLYVLDVNPNPDLSPLAMMYAMADVAGWGFDGLVQRLLDLARGGRIKGR